MKNIDFDFEKFRDEKRNAVDEFLEASKKRIIELLMKGYKTEEILKLLNRALKDESFRKSYDVKIKTINGENAKKARKFINNLRKELKGKKNNETVKRDINKQSDNKQNSTQVKPVKQESKQVPSEAPLNNVPSDIFDI